MPHYDQIKAVLTPPVAAVDSTNSPAKAFYVGVSRTTSRPVSPLRAISPTPFVNTLTTTISSNNNTHQIMSEQRQKSLHSTKVAHKSHCPPVYTVEEIELIKLKKTLKYFTKRMNRLDQAAIQNVNKAKEINDLR